MLPRALQPENFKAYPPEARTLVLAHMEVIRQLPITFLPSLLREVIEYDFKFPREREAIDKELSTIAALSPSKANEWFEPFQAISISPKLENLDWINSPAQFIEQQSAYLWSTHQLDAFRKAATDYGNRLQSAFPLQPLPIRRLGIAIIGQGVSTYDDPLFRNLRAHGTYFTQIKPQNGLNLLLAAAATRADAHPAPFGHWYVDGAAAAEHSPLLTSVSYQAMQPMRAALLKDIQSEIKRPGMGPEELRTYLARLNPSDLGAGGGGNAVLERFKLKILTEGSGTQIFATAFAQWTTREALRRAEPLTLLVRFAPRQRQRPMNEMLSNAGGDTEIDPVGSLVDADMGAYYHWINQQRLPGFDQSVFLVWFEGHNQALVIAPTLPRGTQSSSALDLGQLLTLALS
ncbi:hypothetical protein P8935_00440 [Telmatobacter sp. DSM 110680]|uniref:Uncharacterized protein n=1 Tax=Telmatobacter sp. DSM 110680 TaxID=3036704 RepID=A0AAU7DJK2_9BACT